jgi:hypothetical protein
VYGNQPALGVYSVIYFFQILRRGVAAGVQHSQLKIDLGIKKEHILYFLQSFAEFDIEDKEYQKRLIKTLINSVFVYDDKVMLTFNYSGDNRTISVMEIDAGLATGVRLPRALAYQNTANFKICGVFFAHMVPGAV